MPNPEETAPLSDAHKEFIKSMPTFEEIILDKAPIRTEEFFSVLELDGISYRFAISKEEKYEGGWIYRLYHFNDKDYRFIEEHLHERIRSLMQEITFLLNVGDDLAARTKLDKMLRIWKEQWASGTPHGQGNDGKLII